MHSIPKLFYLKRTKDISGISGTGVVAFGACFFNGKCVICWNSSHSSINEYDSIEDLEFIHGHEGATEIVWLESVSEALRLCCINQKQNDINENREIHEICQFWIDKADESFKRKCNKG
jgi:hypothetical protein